MLETVHYVGKLSIEHYNEMLLSPSRKSTSIKTVYRALQWRYHDDVISGYQENVIIIRMWGPQFWVGGPVGVGAIRC